MAYEGLPGTDTAPEAIDLVVLTHGHEDHYGGLVDPATNRSRFPNADVVIARAELAFWTDPDAGATARTGGVRGLAAFRIPLPVPRDRARIPRRRRVSLAAWCRGLNRTPTETGDGERSTIAAGRARDA